MLDLDLRFSNHKTHLTSQYVGSKAVLEILIEAVKRLVKIVAFKVCCQS